MAIEARFTGARVLHPSGWQDAPLTIRDGWIDDGPAAREIDLAGYDILPGIVDPHGDGFERHMAPRRGALREREAGVVATAAELAANGITTGVLAQFWSWEGGMRGPEFAQEVFAAVSAARPSLPIDLKLQMRLETHDLDTHARAEEAIDTWHIGYVVFNDHLPHARLAEGRRPPRLTGQALKSGRNPEDHLALLMGLQARTAEVPAAMDALCARLSARGILLGSHDDHTLEDRATWRARGARISEFPETEDAAREARDAAEPVILGAPNVVRGASHAGNASALDLIAAGLCTALASDYHYPAPARAARRCVELGLLDWPAAWALVSSGPAELLGLTDRGTFDAGKRADLIVVERASHRIAATISAGHIACLTGRVAERFFAA